jgi:phage tail-like protein
MVAVACAVGMAAPTPSRAQGTLEERARLEVRVTGLSRPVVAEYLGGLASFHAVELFRQGSSGELVKLPGRLHFPAITIRREQVDDTFIRWRGEVSTIPDFRRDIGLEFLDRAAAVIARFRLVGAWPSRYSIAGSAVEKPATGNKAVGVEVVSIVFERSTREQ